MPKSCRPYKGFKLFLIVNNVRFKDVANILNINLKTFYSKINGRSDFTLAEVEKICASYQIKPSTFF